MTTQSDRDTPVYSLKVRKAVMIAFAVPLIVAFVVVLLQFQGLINVEDFGLQENHLYIGGFTTCIVGFIAVLIVWRCPGCKVYLGKEGSPSKCRSCGAIFEPNAQPPSTGRSAR